MDFFDILLAKKLENDKDVSIVQLNVSENGTYSESGKAYSPVVVDVQPPSNSYLRAPIDSYPTTAEQLPIPKCDVEIANQKSCKVFVSNKPFVNDKVPYLFRKSAGGNNVFEKIIGGTIAWNQLVRNGNFASTSGWLAQNSTLSVTNNILSITSNTTSIGASALRTDLNIDSAHVVFASVEAKGNTSAHLKVTFYGSGSVTQSTNSYSLTSSFEQINGIIKTNGTKTNYYLSIDKTTASDQITVDCKNAICIDLTQMFGTTIADYIYSLEQTTAGAGVAWFRSMFPSDYYAYDSGSLQSVNVASKKVYDSNNTLVATYAFDSDVTLRGIPKLDANNNLYYDGDVYESDGTVTRRYGIVDLGSLTWTYASSNTRFYSTDISSLAKRPSDDNSVINGVTALYAVGSVSDLNSNDKILAIATSGNLFIKDTAYTDAIAFKTAMSGVYLVYELATSTTESADVYTNPQIVDADGTEEFVDYAYSQSTRDVAVPVGHDSLYYNGQLYQTDFAQATTDTINMAELHSIVPPSGEFYITSNGTLSVDVWKK